VWRLVLVIAVTAVIAGCDDAPACRAPAHTTYSCDPIPAGGRGCVGGPVWSTVYSTIDAARPQHQDDPALTFPQGCQASIPECSPFYRNEPRAFTCDGTGWSELL